jgi:hypothetical protein
MATTDARAGFRLPWSSDRSSTDGSDDEQLATADPTDQTSANGWTTAEPASLDGSATLEASGPNHGAGTTVATVTEATMETDTQAPVAGVGPAPETPDYPGRTATGRKPSKFLADLTKAMQTAAEDARSIALSQLQADAKSHIEQIHTRSSTDATDLRRVADDDVAAVREWSKAEIARIREETDAKISDRKAELERQIERHAAVIERTIESVQVTVAHFESEMATFFERLLAEEDPTQFATMAERLPEPPTFESLVVAPDVEPATEEVAIEAVAAAEATAGEAVLEPAPTESDLESTVDAEAAPTADAVQLIGDMLVRDTEPIGETGSAEDRQGVDAEIDREAAFTAIQAAAEAAASAEVAADAAARAEAVADIAIEIVGSHGEDGASGQGHESNENNEEADPRVAALGLSPDYDAAEAEALATADASDDEEIPEIGDDALAARLAGLVADRDGKAVAEATATQVIVVGLVSVASIASFKRHLGRLPGVQSVGVSSGPDGEFVFAVNHTEDVILREAVPSMPSFQARVTGTSDGVVNVTAHDPESDN